MANGIASKVSHKHTHAHPSTRALIINVNGGASIVWLYPHHNDYTSKQSFDSLKMQKYRFVSNSLIRKSCIILTVYGCTYAIVHPYQNANPWHKCSIKSHMSPSQMFFSSFVQSRRCGRPAPTQYQNFGYLLWIENYRQFTVISAVRFRTWNAARSQWNMCRTVLFILAYWSIGWTVICSRFQLVRNNYFFVSNAKVYPIQSRLPIAADPFDSVVHNMAWATNRKWLERGLARFWAQWLICIG